MAAPNTSQIFSKVANLGFASTLTAANAATDGTGSVSTVFTADATNGGRCERLRCQALGTNVASVLTVWINNGSTSGTATNNVMYAEIQLPATTASNTAANDINVYELPAQYASQVPYDTTAFPIVLPPGYKINVAIRTTVAGGWAVMAVGGTY